MEVCLREEMLCNDFLYTRGRVLYEARRFMELFVEHWASYDPVWWWWWTHPERWSRQSSDRVCWKAPPPLTGLLGFQPSRTPRRLFYYQTNIILISFLKYLHQSNLFNSLKSIWPFPSMSYILKAHVNFSSAVPELLRGLKGSHQLWENYLVTWRANMNSLKSIVPLRSVSNVLKMISLNLSAQPPGNILLYISTNWALVSSPSGQSSIKPACHSWGKITQSIINC